MCVCAPEERSVWFLLLLGGGGGGGAYWTGPIFLLQRDSLGFILLQGRRKHSLFFGFYVYELDLHSQEIFI